MRAPALARRFFARDPRAVAAELLNKLVAARDGRRDRIVEVEAYCGASEAAAPPASQATGLFPAAPPRRWQVSAMPRAHPRPANSSHGGRRCVIDEQKATLRKRNERWE